MSASISRRALCLAGGACALAGVGRLASAADWLPAPRLPVVPLLDQRARPVQLQRDVLPGRTVVFNFMFTGCQTVCPPQTALLAEALRRLQARGVAAEVAMVSITVDPLADGPAQLRDYGRRFDLPMGEDTPNGAPGPWRLLTGEPAALGRLLQAFGVPAAAPGEHPSLLWLAHSPRARWTRSSSLNPPEALVALVEAIQS